MKTPKKLKVSDTDMQGQPIISDENFRHIFNMICGDENEYTKKQALKIANEIIKAYNAQHTQAKKKVTYFLFGSNAATSAFEEGGVEELKMHAKNEHDFSVFAFTQGDEPLDILGCFSGQGEYAVLTKEEYEQIRKFKS